MMTHETRNASILLRFVAVALVLASCALSLSGYVWPVLVCLFGAWILGKSAR